MPRPLYEILPAMQALSGHGNDPEADHGAADELLIEALESLSGANDSTVLVDAIVLAYRDVEKWYA